MKKLYVISIRRKYLACFLTVILILAACICFFKISELVNAGENGLPSYTSADSVSDMNEGGKLAIIIDDFGQGRAGVKEMMTIDRHLTFAVMPFLEYSQPDAEAAHEKGYEVIVHLPMEPNYGKLSWLGPRPILASLEPIEVQNIVQDSFENVPYAVGANIHMGSKSSSKESIVSGILEVVKERGLYFVDSRTAEHPVAKKIAESYGVLCFERDIFIDEKRPKNEIKKQLKKAADLAVKKGKAIAVGHVGTEGGIPTAEAIQEMLPEFEERNIELVFVSELAE